uniref:JmjC domain-containing protein n=1 Tax=Macrostomum lignano TaxID=282301 RepID=A0A1I8F7D2_9PLAT
QLRPQAWQLPLRHVLPATSRRPHPHPYRGLPRLSSPTSRLRVGHHRGHRRSPGRQSARWCRRSLGGPPGRATRTSAGGCPSIPQPIRQRIVGTDAGAYQLWNETLKSLTLEQYKLLAESDVHSSPEQLERKYWASLTLNPPNLCADVSGSVDGTRTSRLWNHAPLGTLRDSSGTARRGGTSARTAPERSRVKHALPVLRHVEEHLPWHTEDMDLYSINYLHFGAAKHWYAAVPPANGRASLLRLLQGDCPAFFAATKPPVLSPQLLRRHGVPFDSVVQRQGEFIITFPFGYHCGFNAGFNCARATNFASRRWIDFGLAARLCRCQPDSVVIDMAAIVRRFGGRRKCDSAATAAAASAAGTPPSWRPLRVVARRVGLTDGGDRPAAAEAVRSKRVLAQLVGKYKSSSRRLTLQKDAEHFQRMPETSKEDANISKDSRHFRRPMPDTSTGCRHFNKGFRHFEKMPKLQRMMRHFEGCRHFKGIPTIQEDAVIQRVPTYLCHRRRRRAEGRCINEPVQTSIPRSTSRSPPPLTPRALAEAQLTGLAAVRSCFRFGFPAARHSCTRWSPQTDPVQVHLPAAPSRSPPVPLWLLKHGVGSAAVTCGLVQRCLNRRNSCCSVAPAGSTGSRSRPRLAADRPSVGAKLRLVASSSGDGPSGGDSRQSCASP